MTKKKKRNRRDSFILDLRLPKIFPYIRDSDRDGVVDLLDCRPHNPKKHFVPVSFARLFSTPGERKSGKIRPTKKVPEKIMRKAERRGIFEYYGHHEKEPRAKVYINPSYQYQEAKRMKKKYPKEARGFSTERIFVRGFTDTAAHEALHHGISKTKESRKGKIPAEGEELVVESIEKWRKR